MLAGSPGGNAAGTGPGASGGPAGARKSELLALLTTGPAGPPMSAAAAVAGAGAAGVGQQAHIRPRGLVNSGNMCFANSVLQVLVYCPPFNRLFSELGRVLVGPVIGGSGGKEGGTPLVDATVEFLKEFRDDEKKRRERERARGSGVASGSGGRGKGKEKEKEREREVEEEEDDWDGDSFLPSNVYDALKEKKRFDHMRVGYLFFWCSVQSLVPKLTCFWFRADTRKTRRNSWDFILILWRKSYCRS